MRLRYRTLFALVGGAVTALILGILQLRELPKQRAIASAPAPVPLNVGINEEPSICKTMYPVACQGWGQTRRDPTGVVRPDVEGERIVASMYEEIVNKHPDWRAEQVDDELSRTVFTPERRGRIEAAYHWVQYHIEHFIESQPEAVFTIREKKLLEQRIKNTMLDTPPPASVYADEPDLLTKNDVFYERTTDGKMRMRVGGAYLFTAKSWFNMVFTMAHELGHAIDPCETRIARLSFPAYDRLTACFLKTGLVAMTKNRYECSENDQLSETFADWIAAEVTSEALKSFATEFHGTQLVNATTNAVRDLCEEDDSGDLDEVNHPSPRIRIDKIFGQQPAIRTILGCAATPQSATSYCSFDSELPLTHPQQKVSP